MRMMYYLLLVVYRILNKENNTLYAIYLRFTRTRGTEPDCISLLFNLFCLSLSVKQNTEHHSRDVTFRN